MVSCEEVIHRSPDHQGNVIALAASCSLSGLEQKARDAAVQEAWIQREEGEWEWHIRFLVIHPSLGEVTPGLLGHKPEDETEGVQTIFEVFVALA